MTTPISFTSFPLLPLELRHKIWSYCLTPQIVSINISGNTRSSSKPEYTFTINAQSKTQEQPRVPLWNINYETRSWAKSQGMIQLYSKQSVRHKTPWQRLLGHLRSEKHTTLSNAVLFSPRHDILQLQNFDRGLSFLALPYITPIIPDELACCLRVLKIYFVDFNELITATPGAWGPQDLGRLEKLETVIVTGERFADPYVQMQCHVLREKFMSARREGKEWRMPIWRFAEWESLVEAVVSEGRVNELEGLDPKDFEWTR